MITTHKKLVNAEIHNSEYNKTRYYSVRFGKQQIKPEAWQKLNLSPTSSNLRTWINLTISLNTIKQWYALLNSINVAYSEPICDNFGTTLVQLWYNKQTRDHNKVPKIRKFNDSQSALNNHCWIAVYISTKRFIHTWKSIRTTNKAGLESGENSIYKLV